MKAQKTVGRDDLALGVKYTNEPPALKLDTLLKLSGSTSHELRAAYECHCNITDDEANDLQSAANYLRTINKRRNARPAPSRPHEQG